MRNGQGRRRYTSDELAEIAEWVKRRVRNRKRYGHPDGPLSAQDIPFPFEQTAATETIVPTNRGRTTPKRRRE